MGYTLVDSDMSTWAPGTQHYVTDNAVHLAVTVDAGLNDLTAAGIDELLAANGQPTLASGIHKVVVAPTVIVECNDEGIAVSLTPLHTFPPGTSHEDALELAGYA